MSWLETLRTGAEAILSHRLRSALTMLGILIGIAAVILTVGLGEGASAKVNAAIASLGSNLLIVSPGSTTSSGGVRGGLGSANTLTVSDANALLDHRALPDVSAVAPTVQRTDVVTAGSSSWTTTVVGSTPQWLQVRGRQVQDGSFFTGGDVASAAPVAVLGPTTAQNLFGFADPVGQTVNINGQPFTVDGVLNSAGSSATTNEDDQIVVPVSTAQELLLGGIFRNSVQSILIQASSAASLSAAYQEADTELTNLHGITNPLAPDFTITTESSIQSTATSVSHTLTILLGGIAAISLLVGGIGVMNIMLVSVTERIREIGLRKALGATPAIIRRQFLVEASVLGLCGGVIGLLLGVAGAVGLPHLISNPIVISPVAAVIAVAVAVGLGLGFGVYPASRAARLAPIDALRSE
ncbi:MAG TPA: ABC transporter permease [Acidimicrobiales bacterium]|nr:ABC transporter permease [Acidimicrobiales bacterium]